MNDVELRATILSALINVAPEIDNIDLDSDVSFRNQVDLDSIDYLQFVLALEKTFGTEIPDVDYPQLSSLNGALGYLKARTVAAV